MAQFYASIQGNRGEVTRAGSKASGLQGHIRGWNIGVRVDVLHIDGQDVCRVYKTPGSLGRGTDTLISEFKGG